MTNIVTGCVSQNPNITAALTICYLDLLLPVREKILVFLTNHPRVYVGNQAECRLFVEAVLWILRSGAQWRLLPEKYGNWNTIYKPFARWCDHEVWEEMHQHLMQMILSNSSPIKRWK